MSEVVIDPNTGLPELPESQYWKVYEDSNRKQFYAVTHMVGIFETRETQTVTKSQPTWFWQKGVENVEHGIEEVTITAEPVHARHYLGKGLTREEAEAKLAEREARGELGWKLGDDPWGGEEYFFLFNNRFDEANIQRAAIEVVENQQRRARKLEEKRLEDARKAKLVGTYPPKKLEI